MQSAINNCCKILLVCLVLVSCGKNKEDEKLFEELNLCLENSNVAIARNLQDHFYKFEQDSKNPIATDKVAAWKPKAMLVFQLSNDLIAYISSLQEKTKLSNKLDKEDSRILYNSLIKHKEKILSIDDIIKSEIGNLITLTTEGKDTTELTEASFYNSLNNALPKLKLAIYKNRIIRAEEMFVSFCTRQYSTTTCGFDILQAITIQNSTHFKPNETLKITAGVGSFLSRPKPRVLVNNTN